MLFGRIGVYVLCSFAFRYYIASFLGLEHKQRRSVAQVWQSGPPPPDKACWRCLTHAVRFA
ncbi:hypothetical protein HanRHA438_Chr07g0322361 [Helianthus annuus]|nr:hypothetical protein HanRHA438_Chr07g0322361 [Helianthus annuus]